MSTIMSTSTLLKEDEEVEIDKQAFKPTRHKKKGASMELVYYTDKNQNNYSSSSHHGGATKLNVARSLQVKAQTPRININKTPKKQRYIHSRDKSVGSAIPISIRSYTPALIALIDHTKGLQTSALASYGLNRPQTAHTMRDLIGNGHNVSIPMFSQSPPPDTNHREVGYGIANATMPLLTNTESNNSMVKDSSQPMEMHSKQQSGTFLINEVSTDQVNMLEYDDTLNEDSTVFHNDNDVGVFVASPKQSTTIMKNHHSRNSVSQSDTVEISKQGFQFHHPQTNKSAPPHIETVPSQTQLTTTSVGTPTPHNASIINIKDGVTPDVVSGMTASDIAKLIELSTNAGQEYLYLVQINEDLMKERSTLLLRLEDMSNNFNELNATLMEDKRHRRQYSDMGMQLDSLKSQLLTITTENEMFQETVSDLDVQLKQSKETIKKEQFKQIKIMESIAKGENVDINNVDIDDMDESQDVNSARQKSMLEQALTQLEAERQDKSEIETILNETKRELTKMKGERNENGKKVETLTKLVENQQASIDRMMEHATEQFEDLKEQLDEANDFVAANDELARRMAELQQTNVELESDQYRLQSELQDVKQMYQEQLRTHLNESDYTKVALDDEMLQTVGAHMRQLSANWRMASLHGHSRNASGMSASHVTENLGDYFYTLGSGFNGQDISQWRSTRALGVAQFDDEFSQTVMMDDPGDDQKVTESPILNKKTINIAITDETGKSDTNNTTPAPADEIKDKVDENKDKDGAETNPEEEKRKAERKKKIATRIKEQELQKARAEMEFFFLTCMAVKMNLKEAFPTETDALEEDLMGENPWDLFKVAQEQNVPMNKFALWTEQYMRAKYNLGKFRLAGKIKLPNLGLEEKFKQVKIVAHEHGRKGKEKAAQFGSKVGVMTSEVTQQVGERVRKMTLEASDVYQKFKTRGSGTTPPGGLGGGNSNSIIGHTQSMPGSPNQGKNHVSDFEYSTEPSKNDDKTPRNTTPDVGGGGGGTDIPDNNPILEETASQMETENEKKKKKKNTLENNTANMINNSNTNDGKENDNNNNNNNSIKNTDGNNNNRNNPLPCCVVM